MRAILFLILWTYRRVFLGFLLRITKLLVQLPALAPSLAYAETLMKPLLCSIASETAICYNQDTKTLSYPCSLQHVGATGTPLLTAPTSQCSRTITLFFSRVYTRQAPSFPLEPAAYSTEYCTEYWILNKNPKILPVWISDGSDSFKPSFPLFWQKPPSFVVCWGCLTCWKLCYKTEVSASLQVQEFLSSIFSSKQFQWLHRATFPTYYS